MEFQGPSPEFPRIPFRRCVMDNICKNVFKAIHEGKWLSIEYINLENKTTNYWIGIKNIDPVRKMLLVDGLHLSQYTMLEMNIFIGSIKKAEIIDGSYCEINSTMIEDIRLHPGKYINIFYNAANFKVLNYPRKEIVNKYSKNCNQTSGFVE